MQTTMKNIVESLAKQTKALNKQTEALVSNTIGKECKSNIYDKINKTNERVNKIEDDIDIDCENKSRPGLFGKVENISAKVEKFENTLLVISEKTKADINDAIKPLIESINKIEDRNIKKDAISEWKINLPTLLLTILSIVVILGQIANFLLKIK